MSMELFQFSSVNIKHSGIPQSLKSTNVAGIIPVILGSAVLSILVSQLLKLDSTSSEAA